MKNIFLLACAFTFCTLYSMNFNDYTRLDISDYDPDTDGEGLFSEEPRAVERDLIPMHPQEIREIQEKKCKSSVRWILELTPYTVFLGCVTLEGIRYITLPEKPLFPAEEAILGTASIAVSLKAFIDIARLIRWGINGQRQ